MKNFKYYLNKTYSLRNKGWEKLILRNILTECTVINENVDFPSIHVGVDRLKQGHYKKLKNNKLDKYKEINKEDFYTYFSITLDVFKALKWDFEAEFFISNPYRNCYEILLFSNNKENRYKIEIQIYSNLEDADISIEYSYNYKGLAKLRSNAKHIDSDMFEYFYRETIAFLEDDLNYTENIDSFLKLVNSFLEGNTKKVFYSKELDISPIKLILSEHIKIIESRLINNDVDDKSTREKLRGRIEGLRTAINELQKYERESMFK